MDNLWVHSRLKAHRAGYGDFNQVNLARKMYVERHGVPADPSLQKGLYILIACSALVVPMVLGLLFFNFYKVRQSVDSYSPQAMFKTGYSGVDRAQFLSTLSAEQESKARRYIYYISDIIDGIKPGIGTDTATLIVRESFRAGYDPLLVTAVIMAESTFNHRAKSRMGALGLMQLLPKTARYISKIDGIEWRGTHTLLHDPNYNVKLGIAYLKYLENYFEGDRNKILIAYNWGPGNLASAIRSRKRIPASPRQYAKKIMKYYKKWKSEYHDQFSTLKFMKL